MKLSETWVCDVCRRTEITKLFPQDWFEVTVESGSKYYQMADNRNIQKDCCSKKCVREAIKPLIEGV